MELTSKKPMVNFRSPLIWDVFA
ncbi:uncharacterized protein METZ01_LOCUS435809, partial [marine metagenome]